MGDEKLRRPALTPVECDPHDLVTGHCHVRTTKTSQEVLPRVPDPYAKRGVIGIKPRPRSFVSGRGIACSRA